MPKYTLLLRIDPKKTSDVLNALKGLPEKPTTGVTLHYVMNTFGEWDACIWFDADTHDNAMDFVQNKIATISGIERTYTLPTTTIKEYVKGW